MNHNEDAPQGKHGLAGFARRVGALLTKGLTLSGEAELARWTPITEQYPQRTMTRLKGADRSDLRLMMTDRRFTPADLDIAIRRASGGNPSGSQA